MSDAASVSSNPSSVAASNNDPAGTNRTAPVTASSPVEAVSSTEERPELAVAGAFAGGLLLAALLRRIRS